MEHSSSNYRDRTLQNVKEADLIEILKILHKAGIHFSTLDGLNLSPEKEGSNVLDWIEGLRKVRAEHHSHKITEALEKKPRQKRKIKDDLMWRTVSCKTLPNTTQEDEGMFLGRTRENVHSIMDVTQKKSVPHAVLSVVAK